MFFLKRFLFAIALLQTCFPVARACMVTILPLEERVKIADLVLIGEVVEVWKAKHGNKNGDSYLEVKVQEVLKGKAPKELNVWFKSNVTVKGVLGGNRCDRTRADYGKEAIGNTWIFYAKRSGKQFVTSIELSGALKGTSGGGQDFFQAEVEKVKALLKTSN